MTEDEMRGAHEMLSGWIRLAHRRARRKNAQAFREAADIRELWQAILAERRGEGGQGPCR